MREQPKKMQFSIILIRFRAFSVALHSLDRSKVCAARCVRKRLLRKSSVRRIDKSGTLVFRHQKLQTIVSADVCKYEDVVFKQRANAKRLSLTGSL
jgi:hypothetical protein